MFRDVAIVAASLAATYFTSGYSAVVALAAGRDAVKRWNDFRDNFQSAPVDYARYHAYFKPAERRKVLCDATPSWRKTLASVGVRRVRSW